MRVGVLLWADQSWANAAPVWKRAEALGFAHAWVFDHVVWQGVRPWFDGYPILAAAAASTSRIGLGPLVTSPNFRHPVTAAHALKTINDISGGRLTVGVGAGSDSSDLGVLGESPYTSAERASRFAEWVAELSASFEEIPLTSTGTWPTTETVVGGPRPPLAVAAGGPRGLRLVAEYAQTWVTLGNRYVRTGTAENAIIRQTALLEAACADLGRDPATLDRLLLSGVTDERPLASLEAFRDYAGRYAALGITDIVLHWPRPEGRYATGMDVLEAVAADYN